MTELEERQVISVEQAGRILGLGRSASYDAVRRGDMPGVIHLGRRIVISRRALERLLDGELVAPLGRTSSDGNNHQAA